MWHGPCARTSNLQILLLDEPFSALNHTLCIEMRHFVKEMLQHRNIPMILVTHDHADADFFADELWYMQQDSSVKAIFLIEKLYFI